MSANPYSQLAVMTALLPHNVAIQEFQEPHTAESHSLQVALESSR